MKKLVPIKTPNDYHHQGKTIYINPDDVARVEQNAGETVIHLASGEVFNSVETMDVVVAAIEAAL